jgi:hypothetical protein
LVLLSLAILGSVQTVMAQTAPLDPIVTRSHSGQFLVSGRSQPSLLTATLRRDIGTNWIRLDPPLAAVSCERIKDALLWQLNAPDHWRGRIAVQLHPVRSSNDRIQTTQNRYTDGWSYRLDVPDSVAPKELVQALVNVLLMEWANRTATDRPAEVPTWLGAGLAEELLNDRTRDLVVRTPEFATDKPRLREPARQGQFQSTLGPAHECFANRSPLTFDQLCWPAADQFAENNLLAFRYSAQLLVHELLHLRNGRNCMSRMLGELGRYRNWQTAFLRAFDLHFSRILDVDKWWELQTVAFQEKGVATTWSPADSLRRLDEILHVPVQFWQGTNTDGPRAVLSLQSFLAQADERRQVDWLPLKIRQLQVLPLHLSPTLVPLTKEYEQVLTAYLNRRRQSHTGSFAQRLAPADMERLLHGTIRQLDDLDARRTGSRPPPPPTPRPDSPVAATPPKPAGGKVSDRPTR